MERRLAAILAADVVGYSRLMAADEKGTHERLKALRQNVLEPKVAEHRGRIVKLMGDGALVEFASVVDAVECAAAIQKGVAGRQAELPKDQRIEFRIGINIGDIIVEDGDIYGDGVNIAARLEQLAEPGGICVSRNVYNQVKSKVASGFQPIGEHKVKNIPEPVVAYSMLLDSGRVARVIGLKRAGPTRRWPVLAAAAFVVLALTSGGLFALYHREEAPIEAVSGKVEALPLPAKPSIAVLPFANLSDDAAQDYFVDGITNDIITDLSKFSTLFVIAANSTFRYKGEAVKMPDVARDLGVRYVLEGSVQRAGDVLRVNAHLIDATAGRHVWAERYDRPAGDLFAVQQEMARRIAGLIASERGGPVTKAELERIARRSTQNLSAYEYFLRGVGYRNLETKEDTQLAREMFEKASHIDPRYARAIANLALTHLDDIWGDWTASREWSLAKSEELARRAIEIDPSEPLGYMVLGLAYQLRGKADQAISLIENAQALSPNDVHIKHGLASTLAYAGSPEQAIALLEEAQRLDPYYPEVILRDVGQAQFFARRYRDALATFSGITRRQRTSYWLYVAASHAQLEQLDEARAAIEEALKLNPNLTLEREIGRRVENGLAPANAEHLRAALRKAGLPETLSASGLDKRRIAVLPFVNMSADTQNEYFSDGITEELISRLSRLHDVSVIARTSIMQYKETRKSIAEIGRELQVGTILEGSVRKAGDRLRITAQLIDVASQAHLWSEDYDRDMTDVFAIQSDVAQHVTQALQVTLKPAEARQIAKAGTADLDAYDAYLKGLYHQNIFSQQGLERSIEYFEQAIARDPAFAKAYGAMALSYDLLGEGYLPPDEAFPKLKEAAHRALEIDAANAEAYTALAAAATFYDRDWIRADEGFRRALELNPNSAIAHDWYGAAYLRPMGRHDEAIAHGQRAKELDPLTPYIRVDLGFAYNFARRYDEAIAECKQIPDIDPNFYFTYWCLGYAYWQKAMLEEALAAYERGVGLNPGDLRVKAHLAMVYADAGNNGRAQQILEELEEKARREYVPGVALAWAHMAVGDLDGAFASMDDMYEQRDPELIWMNAHVIHDGLRSDPRFQQLLRKIGFTEAQIDAADALAGKRG